MSYVGDFRTNVVINHKFTTVDTAGGITTFSGSPILGVYKDNSTTETILGVTTTVDFDSRIGFHNILIDLSQNTGFYTAGSDFFCTILAGTVNSVSVAGYVPFSFSVENRPFSNTERNATADALLNRDMSLGTDSGSTTVRTPRQALRFLRNKWTILSSTLSVKKEDDSTESWSATVGTTTTADPITSLDPAG
jgi:hypothetical protein